MQYSAAMHRFTMMMMGCALVWTGASAVHADEVPLDKVPAVVTQALKERFPNMQIVKAERDTDGGENSYEFKLMRDGRKTEAEFTPEGQFIRSKEGLTEAELPASVKESLRQKYPAARIKDVTRVTTGEGDKRTVLYKSDVKVGRVDRDIVIDASGKLVLDRVD